MKATSPKKAGNRFRNNDQGMAMLVTLLMSLMLTAASSGLIIRMVMGRKLGSSESYQQMAETAALNGFNRILATVNKDDDTNYRGYYLSLSNNEGRPDIEGDEEWLWQTANDRPSPRPLNELCTDTSVGLSDNWPREKIALTNGESQRNDKKGEIDLYYRLRGYSSPESEKITSGEGTFQIEGFVQRRESSGEEDQYLARTLLTRSLYIESIVAAEDDWAVIAGHHMELNGSKIVRKTDGKSGSGIIILDLDEPSAFQKSGSCSKESKGQLVQATNEITRGKIWPTFGRGLPLTTLFNSEPMIDKENEEIRLWSFDDSDRLASNTNSQETNYFHDNCKNSIICTRGESDSEFRTPEGVNVTEQPSGNEILINADQICVEQEGKACHIYIEHLRLTKTKLFIENKTTPVVLKIAKPAGSQFSGSLNLSGQSQLCGSNGSNTCNQEPEKFVISADNGQSGMACTSSSYVLNFSGETLPAALVHLPRGTVRTQGETTMHGLIWAHSVCTDSNGITLQTEDSNGTVVRAADSLWEWSEKGFPGYGRMVTRGIRGTGLDTFKRW